MGSWSFDVQGPLVSAVRTTQRGKFCSPAYKRYASFKQVVRAIADIAGVPQDLDPDGIYSVTVEVWWKKRQRQDCDNLIKSFLDSLWRQDRRVLETHYQAHESAGREWALVKIEKRGACGL